MAPEEEEQKSIDSLLAVEPVDFMNPVDLHYLILQYLGPKSIVPDRLREDRDMPPTEIDPTGSDAALTSGIKKS